jgi:hypothetical protein
MKALGWGHGVLTQALSFWEEWGLLSRMGTSGREEERTQREMKGWVASLAQLG